MRNNDIENILYIQLVISRLGEKELMNWWNTDIAYKLGGAAFLQSLLGELIAPLAAAEGILKAAKLKEIQLIKEIPKNQTVYTLFHPEPKITTALQGKLRHYKRYPEDVPLKIKQLLDPNKSWTSNELITLIPTIENAEFTGTSFGQKLVQSGLKKSEDVIYKCATGIVGLCKQNQYLLCYSLGENNGTI